MTEGMKTLSLRQFRERAAEIVEVIQIAVRDSDGNLRILVYFTPYTAVPVTVEATIPGPRVIRTPEDAAAAVTPRGVAYPKSAQTGRRK